MNDEDIKYLFAEAQRCRELEAQRCRELGPAPDVLDGSSTWISRTPAREHIKLTVGLLCLWFGAGLIYGAL